MADYQKMYAILCGAVDDALMGLEQGSSAACTAILFTWPNFITPSFFLPTS